jgi:hypothetical protein
MKKIILLMTFVAITAIGYSQNFGLGIQSSFYTHGISAKFKMNDFHAVQAVVSLLGPYSSYSARYMKSFEEHDLGSSVELQPYVVGMGSLHTITVPNYLGQNTTVSSSFGYGIGGGVSWKFSSFENFEISNEIAWTTIATPFYSGYNWSAIHFGFGLHYYFGN